MTTKISNEEYLAKMDAAIAKGDMKAATLKNLIDSYKLNLERVEADVAARKDKRARMEAVIANASDHAAKIDELRKVEREARTKWNAECEAIEATDSILDVDDEKPKPPKPKIIAEALAEIGYLSEITNSVNRDVAKIYYNR